MPTTKIIDIDKLKQVVPLVNTWKDLYALVGNQRSNRLKAACKDHNIDTSHFLGSKWNHPPKGPRRPITDYLSNAVGITSNELKKRLIKEGIKEHRCERCHHTEWQGVPIPIDLHHIDGVHKNNALDNLQILCPNCHSLTPNFKGASTKAKKRREIETSLEDYKAAIESSCSLREVCRKLGISDRGGNHPTIQRIMSIHGFQLIPKPTKTIIPKEMIENLIIKHPAQKKSGLTRVQSGVKRRKVTWPTIEELNVLIWEMSIEKIGALYGVTDNTVRRWAKKYGMQLPPTGYWVRRNAGFTHEESLISQNRVRPLLRRPTKEQAQIVFSMLQEGSSWRAAGLAIGFDHETTQIALARFSLIPEGYELTTTRHGSPTVRKIKRISDSNG